MLKPCLRMILLGSTIFIFHLHFVYLWKNFRETDLKIDFEKKRGNTRRKLFIGSLQNCSDSIYDIHNIFRMRFPKIASSPIFCELESDPNEESSLRIQNHKWFFFLFWSSDTSGPWDKWPQGLVGPRIVDPRTSDPLRLQADDSKRILGLVDPRTSDICNNYLQD